jgi:hypothetical protein
MMYVVRAVEQGNAHHRTVLDDEVEWSWIEQSASLSEYSTPACAWLR